MQGDPHGVKKRRVIPIPKRGKPSTDIQNLRLISLTAGKKSGMWGYKLLERLVMARIPWSLDNNRLSSKQMGYWPALPSQGSLAVIYHYLYKDKSQGG